MNTKLVSAARQINLLKRLITVAVIIIVTVIPMWVLYVKSVQFYQINTLGGHIRQIDIEMYYESMETPSYTTNVEREDPLDWKFVVNKTYKLSNLKPWATVPIIKPKDPNRPGEMGREYQIPKDKEATASAMFSEQNYNLFASAAISMNRSLPDVRPLQCRDLSYNAKLPDTSIIIIFHNEALPTLLRTIYSIIERSPRSLLKEIILVDDVSDIQNYGNVLEKFIELLPVEVKLIRSKTRIGLIRARLLGAKHATGNVLTFLDAHIECTRGWLEPLLHQIANDRSTVVCPMIDSLNAATLHYTLFKVTPIGFHWYLQLDWDPRPYESFYDMRANKTEPFSSPSMIGCAFAIDREFFYEIGSYDEGLEIWGSENLELALRVWQCGGRLEIVPCSHVGHLYRVSSYSFDGNKTDIINRNNIRVAEVWMDEYKEFFYNVRPDARKLIPSSGDLSERKALRQKLKCKSFDWYLKNVYPDTTMNAVPVAMGEIRNEKNGMCLEVVGNSYVYLYHCHGTGGNQSFVYTEDDRILSTSTNCMTADMESEFVYASFCAYESDGIKWQYNEKRKMITEVGSGKCLGSLADDGTIYVQLQTCANFESQRWTIKKV